MSTHSQTHAFFKHRPRVAVRMILLAIACLLPTVLMADIRRITAEGQKEMLKDPGTDSAGARDPDVIVVEYFDYNCPYCRKFAPALRALIAEDHKVAIVFKEWPILGDVSVYAAKSALAARWQGKYLIAQEALMGGPRLTENAQVDAILRRAGIDVDRMRHDAATHAADIDAVLERNDAEAHALSLRGTPGIVIGRQLLSGIVDLDGLRQLVAESRLHP